MAEVMDATFAIEQVLLARVLVLGPGFISEGARVRCRYLAEQLVADIAVRSEGRAHDESHGSD